MNDLVSIIVPVYNAEKYIVETLESLLSQTYKNIEIILIDDCSKDNSLEICENYAAKDARIRILKNEVNSGPSKTRNNGIESAIGEFITFVDSDDCCSPFYVEFLLNEMKTNNVDIAMCGYTCIPNDFDNEKKSKTVIKDKNYFLTELCLNRKIKGFTPTKMFKREILMDNKILFDEKLRFCEDYCLNLEYFLNISSGAAIDEKLYYYRQVENSITHKNVIENEIALISLLERKKVELFEKDVRSMANLDMHICEKYINIVANYKTNPIKDCLRKYKKSIFKSDMLFINKVLLYLIINNPKLYVLYNLLYKIEFKLKFYC